MAVSISKPQLKKLAWLAVAGFVLINIVAFAHAYKFTHFSEQAVGRTKGIAHLSTPQKIKTLLLGIDNPKPINKFNPKQSYSTLKIKGSELLEAWVIKTDSSKGTVILFHGYTGNKAAMLSQSDEFIALGYNTMLVDFAGSGGSEGNETTVGYKEAQDVKACYDYLVHKGEKNILLYGVSMGSAAILKAMNDYPLQPAALIIECPFGTMYQTTCARFKNMGVPSFPMASVLLFWGGLQTGFNPFTHNPIEYAKSVKSPTLLLWGACDATVSRQETTAIFSNLEGPKKLIVYQNAGHENYLKKYRKEWVHDVAVFLKQR